MNSDFIRCGLCFDDCESLLNGLEIIKQKVNQGDTCLKRIVRCKNLFAENQRKYGEDVGSSNREWLYRYAGMS